MPLSTRKAGIFLLGTFLAAMMLTAHADGQSGPQWPDVRPFTPVQGSSIENVSQTNGSLNVHIPLASVKQLGKLKLDYWLAYAPPTFTLDFDCDDDVGHPAPQSCGSHWPMCPPPQQARDCSSTWIFDSGLPGKPGLIGMYVASSLDYLVRLQLFYSSEGVPPIHSLAGYYWEVVDPNNGTHRMLNTSGTQWRAVDASGFVYDSSTCTLLDGDGIAYQFQCTATPEYVSNPTVLQTVTDTNGNRITINPPGSTLYSTITDSRGNNIQPWSQTTTADNACPTGTPLESKWTPPGVSSPIVLCSATTHIRSQLFNGNGYPDFDGGVNLNQEAVEDWWMVHSLTLPTGENYYFEYQNPNTPAPINYGELSRITFPTGGSVAYRWQETTQICGVTPSGGAFGTGITERDVYASATATPAVWLYNIQTYGASRGGTVTDPLGNTVSFTYAGGPPPPSHPVNCGMYPHVTTYQDASGRLLKSTTTEYQWYPVDLLSQAPGVNDPLTLEGLPTSTTTTWADGRTKQTTYSYDSGFVVNTLGNTTTTVPFGKQVSQTEYGYGTSAPGGPLLNHSTSYKAFTTPAPFLASNLLNLEDNIVETDIAVTGTNRQTTYAYDDGVHGNLTGVTRHLHTSNSSLSTTYTYNSNGMLRSMTLPHDAVTPDSTTTYGYDPAYQGAVPTSVTDALNHTFTIAYDAASLRPTSATDANGMTTTWSYYSDGRLQSIGYPDGGQHNYAYPSSTEVDESIKRTSSQNVSTRTLYDGLGRKSVTSLQGGCTGGGDITVETTYDAMDRVFSVANPHCPSDPILNTYNGSAGSGQPGYDGLGRQLLVTNPDGTTRTFAYNDRSVDAAQDSSSTTDERGSVVSQIADALGYKVGVVEPGALRTTYTNNAFGDLMNVLQAGNGSEQARARHFTYDSLGRLLTATNPETATVSFIYDNHGNATQKTDARGLSTYYGYDALNRLTAKTRAGGSTDSYFYDGQVGPWASPSLLGSRPNAVGRLSFMRSFNPALAGASCQSAGQRNCDDQYFSYDAMGRLNQWVGAPPSEWGSTAHSISAVYDLAGNVTSLTYPDGRNVANSYDAAGRLFSVTDSSGPVFVNSVQYFPNGTPQFMQFSNGNMGEYTSLNSRLQVCESRVGNGGGAGTFFDRQYFYQGGGSTESLCGNATGNNGNLFQVLDGINSAFQQNYIYDPLNRLTHWNGSSPAGAVRQQSFGYDSFGNMLPAWSSTAPTVDNTKFDAGNHRVNQGGQDCTAYDAAGNTTCFGTAGSDQYSSTFDTESRLATFQHFQNNSPPLSVYTYDANGQRVRADQNFGGSSQGTWREYSYFNGQMLAEKDQTGAWTDYIYANGKRLAKVEQQRPLMHVHGTHTQNCYQDFWVDLGQFGDSTVHAGDRLAFMQKSTARGGLYFTFSNGTGMAWNAPDQEGNPMNFGVSDGQWHVRIVNFPPESVGAYVTGIASTTEAATPLGSWDTWIADISMVSTDGEVRPVFRGQPMTGYPWSQCDTNLSLATETTPVDSQIGSTYYTGDQVGTATMEWAVDAWPIERSEMAPFGQELTVPTFTRNHYKFTGKERDAESGLDYFGARFYSSNLGRWMSPDWATRITPVPYADLSRPQSLNLYGYLGNNPLIGSDPDGHSGDWLWWQQAQQLFNRGKNQPA